MKKFFVGIDFSKRRMDVSIVKKIFLNEQLLTSCSQTMLKVQKKCAIGSNVRQEQARNMMVRFCSVANIQVLIAWRFATISAKMANTSGWAILWTSSAAWGLSEERTM